MSLGKGTVGLSIVLKLMLLEQLVRSSGGFIAQGCGPAHDKQIAGDHALKHSDLIHSDLRDNFMFGIY